MFKTKLRDLTSYDAWEQDFGAAATSALWTALILGEEVTVIGLSTGDSGSPEHNYYDIKLQDGTVLMAISGMHLLNIADFKHKRGVQFSLELTIVDGAGADLDHAEMERQLTFAIERAMINFGYRGKKTTVGLVKYQTEYDIPA